MRDLSPHNMLASTVDSWLYERSSVAKSGMLTNDALLIFVRSQYDRSTLVTDAYDALAKDVAGRLPLRPTHLTVVEVHVHPFRQAAHDTCKPDSANAAYKHK